MPAGAGWEIGVSVHFISYFLKPIDGKLIVEGIQGSSTAKNTNFHEWGAASLENFIIGFIRVYLRNMTQSLPLG